MKTTPLAWITSSLLLFSMSDISYAQPDKLRFENLSGQRGLPKCGVHKILQDQEGFMWFATYEGLYRFDGYSATVFQHDPNDPEHSLQSNLIHTLHEDRKGRLWAGTSMGLVHIDKRTGQATLHQPDSALVIKDILEDKEGVLWLGTVRGIVRFSPDTKQFGLNSKGLNKGLFCLQQDDSGNLWALSSDGLYRFHPPTEKLVLFPIIRLNGRPSFNPLSLSIDQTGIAWVGTHGDGLFRMDTRTPGQFVSYNPDGVVANIISEVYLAADHLWLATSEGLRRMNPRTKQVVDYGYEVSTTYKDRLGNLWVGTSNGVSKAALNSSPFYTTPASPIRKENDILNILEDHSGTVWVGTSGKGLCRFDRTTQRMSSVNVNPADSRNSIEGMQWPLLEDGEGRLWVGTDTDKGLYLLDRKTDRFTRYSSKISVRVMTLAPSGTIWLGGDTGEVAAFDPATKTFTYFPVGGSWVLAILMSQSGDVWVSSYDGLLRLNPTTGNVTRYMPNRQTPAGSLNDKIVVTLYEDKEGIIWIGTAEGGLNRLDPITQVFTNFTTREGLPSNQVKSIMGDERGYLWLGTTQGLCRFDPTTHICRNFDESDGLPDNFFNVGSIYRRNGKLFLGSGNGLVIFHPDSIKESTNTLSVYITSLKVQEKQLALSLNKNYSFDKNIELPYKENFLSFDFTAINYSSPEKTQYAYQLLGVDPEWVPSGNRRFANYTDLSPGSYTFRVKASIDNNAWNEAEATIKILIHPPWWQTWWAYSLYALLGIGVLFGSVHYTISRERLKSDLKLKQLEAEKMHEIDHLKSRFFANISHEFRTPLTLILGPLEKFLSRTSAENDDTPVFKMMQRNAQRLLHLINQLLDLSKLEAGNLKLEVKPSAIISFLKTIVLSFTSLAERRHIQYHLQYPTDNPVVYFDADKLEKIITNLLSNAFKFTPEGGKITVTARLHPAKEQPILTRFTKAGQSSKVNKLELKIQDNGTGIPKDQLPKIFDRFYQTDTSHTREQEGSGIGLSLVRELVELHEGEVIVESKPGEGACFTVHLPLLAADFEELTIVDHTLENGQQSITPFTDDAPYKTDDLSESITEGAPLVLIVEDNADIRFFIRENLQPDYKVIEANDGEGGYSLAVEIIPDLILSDVMMPKMDGVELCRRLKQDKKTDHIPVILLTARASGESKIEGFETGADDYIIKPFEAPELLVRIKNLIEGRKKLRERFSREITLQPSSTTITSRDEKLLQHVIKIVEGHMADSDFGVEAFCSKAGMSRTQLHRKLKALTDQSPGDFIRIMRLKRAFELLTHSAGNIAEVAYQVGFQDPSYFTKCFQKQFGKTPSAIMAQPETRFSQQ